MSLSVAQFIEALSRIDLLTAAEIETLKAAWTEKSAADADALARELVEHGKLSRFQAAAVYQGRAEALVLGNYLVLDKLGAGGMGQVFRARHRRMDRVVALKVLPKKLLGSPDAIARFQREVKAAARLTHQHIVTAYDADEAAGMLYLVMEYVDGQDLAAIVKAHGPMSVAQAMDCVVQAARGLEHAHAQGIIHRDVKPSNLLLDKQGTVKILDMGLARFDNPLADGGSDDGLTAAGSVMGTVDFMSPEQALDTKHADARSDIYSLGCTLYYLLTGKKPYDADTSMKKLVAHREAPIPPLTAARPDVPPGLEAVYRKLVAKRPEQRYATMREAREALEAAKAGRAAAPIAIAPAPVAASAPPADLPTGSPRSSKKKAAAARSKTPLIAAGVAIVLLLGIGGWLVPGMLSKQDVGDADATAAVATTTAAVANTTVASRERQRPEAVAPSNTAAPATATPAPAKPPAIAAAPATAAAVPAPASNSGGVPSIPFDPALERKAAEWVLRVGGKVEVAVEGRSPVIVDPADQLPAGPLRVFGVSLVHLRQTNDDDLARLDGLSHLLRLNLYDTGITSGAGRSIRRHPWLDSLVASETGFGDPGVEQIGTLSRLTNIDLGTTPVTDRGLEILAKMKSLRAVMLHMCAVTDAGVAALSRLPLERLSLQHTGITDAALQELATCKSLRSLYLNDTAVTDAGVASLGSLPALRTLQLGGTRITDGSITTLGGMNSLADLALSNSRISKAGYEKLREALPSCKIEWSPSKEPAVATAPPASPAPEVPFNPALERKAAEWVFSRGGKVEIETEGKKLTTLTGADQLPNQQFVVRAVDLQGIQQVNDQALAKLDGLSHLTRLELYNTGITSDAAAHIRLHPWLSVLDVPRTAFGDAGIEQLSGCAGASRGRVANERVARGKT